MSNHQKVDHTYGIPSFDDAGLGPGSGGQSGDIQGLDNLAEANSESVVELLEEGQFFEAEVVSGVENAPDADVSEVYTREVENYDVESDEDSVENDTASEDREGF